MPKSLFEEEDIKGFFHEGENKNTDNKSEPRIEVGFQPLDNQKPAPAPPHPQKETLKPSNYPKKRSNFVNIIILLFKYTLLFIIIYIFSYSLINFSSLKENGKYTWRVNYKKEIYPQTIPTATNSQSDFLMIPKIGVKAPITWNVPEDEILDYLQKGVVHYKGTALPGQLGNILINGHSSYYPWSPGSYKTVFALLDKLTPGDKIYINYSGVIFSYEVTDRVVISPDNLSPLIKVNESRLSLITCVPIGTDLYRLVVISKQIPS